MHKFVLPLLLLVSACNQTPTTKHGADGYTFGTPQYEINETVIRKVTYKDKAEFNKAALKYSGLTGVAAFTILYTDKSCTIHMMDPSISYEPEYIGHEVLHCFYGQWHTDNDSFN